MGLLRWKSFLDFLNKVALLFKSWKHNSNIVLVYLININLEDVPKKIDSSKKKIQTKIERSGAKFSHEHDLGALDPAFSLIKKRPKKTCFQT